MWYITCSYLHRGLTPLKVLPALDSISLAQPPECLGLTHAKPPECRKIVDEKLIYKSNPPASSPDILSSSSEQRSNLAAELLDSPSNPRTAYTLCATCPIAAKQPFSRLPVVQLLTTPDEDLTMSSIRGSLSLFQRPLVTEMHLQPWSCSKITRAEAKRASRKELLNKEGFFTRISHFLKAGPQNHLSVSFQEVKPVQRSFMLQKPC